MPKKPAAKPKSAAKPKPAAKPAKKARPGKPPPKGAKKAAAGNRPAKPAKKSPAQGGARLRVANETWLGGVFALPTYVKEGTDVFRPEISFWMTELGVVLGFGLLPAGTSAARAADTVLQVGRAPMVGPPRLPSSVRVASPDLAEALRKKLGDAISVRVTPTPELDATMEAMKGFFAQQTFEDDTATYFGPGIEEAPLAAFFSAAAALFRAAPWKIVPSDTDILALSAPELGVKDAVVCVIGQAAQARAVLVFPDIQSFEDYLEAAEDIAEGGTPERLANHFVINYDEADDVPPELQEEVTRHGWELAGPEAYPSIVHVDDDIVARGPTAEELTAAEALARALTRFLSEADPEALAAAFEEGAPVERTLRVTTHGGAFDLTLRAPHPASV